MAFVEHAAKVLVLVFVVLLAWHFLRPPCQFRIRVRGERVEVIGRVAAVLHPRIGEFFRKELPEVRRADVEGYWEGVRLRLRFHGIPSPAHQQRIRNFLNLLL